MDMELVFPEDAREARARSGRNLSEFEARFNTEQACRDYLFRTRWPEGFRCPRCGGGNFWPVRAVLMQCRQCGHQTSVTAGTIFQDTRKPLVDWFRAMYWLASQKNSRRVAASASKIATRSPMIRTGTPAAQRFATAIETECSLRYHEDRSTRTVSVLIFWTMRLVMSVVSEK